MALHSQQLLRPIHQPHANAFKSALNVSGRQCRSVTRSSSPEQQQQQTSNAPSGGMALNEDMLSQLRKAQEEAARLKKELEELQQQKVLALVHIRHEMQQAAAHVA